MTLPGLRWMSSEDAERKGPLKPVTKGDTVLVENPPNEPLRMSADEADLSGIRLLQQASEARKNDPTKRD